MDMRPITKVDDRILEKAWKVVNEEIEDGIENLYLVSERHVETDEKGVVRYDSEPKVENRVVD